MTVTPSLHAHGGISGTWSVIAWDGGLALVLAAAYGCGRSWTAWAAASVSPPAKAARGRGPYQGLIGR
jgi:hypothetical protein